MKESLLAQGIHISIDKFQARETLCLGWLMGSHPKSVNHKDLEIAMKNFRFTVDFTGTMIVPFGVECRAQVIRITKSEALDWKTATRAAHLYVAVDNNRQLFMRFLIFVSKQNELGFPPGSGIMVCALNNGLQDCADSVPSIERQENAGPTCNIFGKDGDYPGIPHCNTR